MRAIQVQKTGGPEVLTLVDLPVPKPKANEAVVKIAASGVNFIDVYFREGRYPATLPFTDGQEAAGTVTEVGSDVKSVNAGDRVAYSNVVGTYAEYAAVPAERLVHVPDKITDQQAAAAMLQGMTAHYLSHTTYQLKKGDTALIHAAAGGVGLLLVQMAKNIGARVIGTAGSEEKAKLARDAGADEVILYASQDFEAETKRLTDGKGVHVVYDGVGQTTFEKGLNVLRPRGHMILFGASSGPVQPVDPIKQLMAKGSLTLTRPSLIHYVTSRDELQQRAGDVFAMIGAGKLKLRISKTYKLEEVQQAHRDLEGRKTTGKILLVP
jgi:NADPH2:quinone reductase